MAVNSAPDDKKLARTVLDRHEQMAQERREWEPLWRKVAQYIDPLFAKARTL